MFRDRDELASSADLPAVLREALGQAAHLIVLCSPAAARSRWVNEEITEFKRLGHSDRILPLIVDGEPHAEVPERECFPPALRFQVDVDGRLTEQPAEPVAADLRSAADGKENAKLKLIAGLLGVPFNELRQRELIAARRRARIWQGIGASMLLLAVLAATGGWSAWRYARHAEGLLAEAIRISADQVGGAVNVADQQGVSRKAIEELLARAESAFNGLYARMARAPALPWRQSTVPPPLRGQNASRLLALADLYGKLGNIERQREMAEPARSELASVVAEEPAEPRWREQLALSHDLIADSYATQWQVDDALAGYRAALAIREGLAADDPGNLRWQREIGLSNISIGDMLRRQGKWGPALDAFRKAVAIEERLVAGAPSDLQAQRDLLMGRQRVGDMLLKQGEDPVRNFTIGPRVGFALGHSQVDSFEEKGDTGAELRYSGLNQTSVQTNLGAAATVAIAIPSGVLLPQASVAWVHEYANDARNIDARFVDAPGSPRFTFQRERPARDWANIARGVSASFTNGMQPFVQFVTVQGNDNYVSYGGTAGLRFSF